MTMKRSKNIRFVTVCIGDNQRCAECGADLTGLDLPHVVITADGLTRHYPACPARAPLHQQLPCGAGKLTRPAAETTHASGSELTSSLVRKKGFARVVKRTKFPGAGVVILVHAFQAMLNGAPRSGRGYRIYLTHERVARVGNGMRRQRKSLFNRKPIIMVVRAIQTFGPKNRTTPGRSGGAQWQLC